MEKKHLDKISILLKKKWSKKYQSK
jgi:hypothetical protein